jgi:hypothetical protein
LCLTSPLGDSCLLGPGFSSHVQMSPSSFALVDVIDSEIEPSSAKRHHQQS